MDRNTLIQRLLDTPGEIKHGEKVLLDCLNALQRAKDRLTEKETELILAGAIDGKNAETRTAQMRQMTATEREAVAEEEHVLSLHRCDLNNLQNEFKALQAVARLIADAS